MGDGVRQLASGVTGRRQVESPEAAMKRSSATAFSRRSRQPARFPGSGLPAHVSRASGWIAIAAAFALQVALLALSGSALWATKLLLALAAGALLVALVIYAHQQQDYRRVCAAHAKAHQLAELHAAVIASFAMAIDAKGQHTHGHTERVRDLALMIGRELGLGEDDLEALKMAAMLHDIGKLAIPDYILSKPGELSEDEKRKVRTHTLVGAAILESVEFPWPVADIIRSHHEWYDGTGYPHGLSGEDILLPARILAVADSYDSLLSNRPFRPAMSVQEAVRTMQAGSGTQFDPEVLDACLRCLALEHADGRLDFLYDGSDGQPAKVDSPDREAAFKDIKQAHQELLGLYEVVQTMGRSLNVEETLELIISKTRRIIEFSTCALFLYHPDRGQLRVDAAAGPYSGAIRGQWLPMGKGLSGRVTTDGQPSGIGRSASEDLALLLGSSAKECTLAEALSVPLSSEMETIGALTLYRTKGKPFTEDDLRLAGQVARQAAIAIGNAREYEQTKRYALTDELTGLANARSFFLRLREELSRARRESVPVSLIAADVDRLKQVNDNFGHPQGDRVLRILAEIFRRHVRDYDTVVRYAGDEFFIILPGTPNSRALETMDRIRRAVRETYVEMPGGKSVRLGASFGVATFPGDAEDADSLIAKADQALYAEKRLNRQAAQFRAVHERAKGQSAAAEQAGGDTAQG
jgi:diguanylate cyclase (GGDEF)-like protein/putative nucleotidyltransferase with HDIG domain